MLLSAKTQITFTRAETLLIEEAICEKMGNYILDSR